MKKGILVIGDDSEGRNKPAKPFLTFKEHIKKLASKKRELHTASYNDVFADNLPELESKKIMVVLFFPFEYWNEHVEIYTKDKRVYGDSSFGRDFEGFFREMEKRVKKRYKKHDISYLNHPRASIVERDKKIAKTKLLRKGVSTPKLFNVRTPRDLKNIIDRGKAVYIKPRFGAMGKGISYINKDILHTNFPTRKGALKPKRSDFGWKFYSVNKQKRDEFLRTISFKDFIFEEAIEPPVNKGRRFDFRVHVVCGKTPYFYAKSTPQEIPITNWTQGGRIEKKKFLSKNMPKTSIKAMRALAVKAAETLGLNYAGIDIVMSTDLKKAYCLEAHSFPGYESGFDIMKYVAKIVLKS